MKRLAALVVALAFACAISRDANAQASPYHYLSAASTNSTLVTAGKALVFAIATINTTTTVYYLKLYDKVSAPTCNSDNVKFTLPVPYGASNAGGGIVVPFPSGLHFQQGFGFCLTAGSADNDNTNAATGVIVNFAVKQF